MGLFWTHRQAARATNRGIARFFAAMTVVTVLALAIIAVELWLAR